MAAKPDSLNRRLAAFGLAIALALPLAACNADAPATPTYAKDVKVILDAHCVRCHGANCMLNSTPGLKFPLNVTAPQLCYLESYDGPSGAMGAMGCAALFPAYIGVPDNATLRMPPKPSDALSAYETDVLLRWAKLNPPPP